MQPREPAIVNDDDVLDDERLLAITGGSRQAARELLAMLIDDGRTLVAQIRAAVANGNRAAVRDAAHALKGIAGNVGAPCLERAARAIERCPTGEGVAAVEEELAAVEARVSAFGRATVTLSKPC
jgi:HPt (histidine-containing phosphotransfer) domain-containing protein